MPFPVEKVHTDYVGRIERGFNTLEKTLETRTFLVGERLTIADIHVATTFLFAAEWFLGKGNIVKYPSVVRFVETVLNQPRIAHFWSVEWPEKALAYSTPPEDTEEGDKPRTTPAQKPKKEEKPKAKEPKPEHEDDLVPKEEPKAKNPLDSLPKSIFSLEDWRRAYSNKDTKGPGGSIEWLYEQ